MLDTPRPSATPQGGAPAATAPDTQDQGPDSAALKKWGIIAALCALAIAGIGIISRIHSNDALRSTAAQAAIPDVTVVSPSRPQNNPLVLPANIQAYNSAAIFARTNGYVRKWLVDIGQRVSSGQVLATLDAPDLDQQLAQARADYQTALANQHLAEITARRWTTMLAQDAVSRQESDEKTGDLEAKRALSNASLANVRRLLALEGFTRLTAPFSGVVSSRATQIGQLVVAGNAASAPLFTISDTHRMRIYVRVPQGQIAQVQNGASATITLPEYPGRKYTAVLVHNSGAVDQQSGSVLIELQTDNIDGALKPGAFAEVSFDHNGGGGGDLTLPGSTVLYTNNGPAVAVVNGHGRVTVKPIRITRDAGATVSIAGLSPSDRIIDTPPDSIRNGDQVRVANTLKGVPNAS
ncbi:MAG: efflux RND transporter periplasmic adaptor subunit [Pseudomonadota bacterium]|nr:efflux RND transporter periplasmic adaptor subunit [Pseudomonadota bacterium]